MRIYGQEINDLTSAIGRMNLFLHGVSDFHIVTGDTLRNPAFVVGGQLQQFDLVLAIIWSSFSSIHNVHNDIANLAAA